MLPFLKGLLIGFSIAAPVGPIGLLCIRRSIVNGRWAGFVSGLGAATADALCGMIAALGLTAVTAVLLRYRVWLQCGGGVFLIWLGWAMLRARPAAEAAHARGGNNLPGMFGSTLVLTLMNPMTILSFLGIFAGAGVIVERGAGPASLLVGGVFLGSAVWWLLLSGLASWFGARLEKGGLRAVNVVAGAVIVVFGFWQLAVVAWSWK